MVLSKVLIFANNAQKIVLHAIGDKMLINVLNANNNFFCITLIAILIAQMVKSNLIYFNI